MTKKPESELLIEIAKLIEKYSPEISESIAENLSSPEFLQHLVAILSPSQKGARTSQKKESQIVKENQRSKNNARPSLAKVSPTDLKKENQSEKGKQTLKPSHPSFLNELEKTEPDKSALLIKFYDGLMAQTFLPTLQDIRAFASDTGLSRIKATSRNKAIIPLVKALLHFSVEKLRTKLAKVMPVSTQDDRSLEGWANIILDKELRSKQED